MQKKDLKGLVKDKYGEIAKKSILLSAGSCCSEPDYSVFSDSYSELKGYLPDADMSLGCGLPTQYAGISAGDRVLDLGSGAGNDCFVARSLVGDSGHVTGIDFTEEMISKANKNLEKTGYKNIDFLLGDIESMPLDDYSQDVVISNCVLNLVPDKQKAFSEISRVLGPGGHFCISDVVLQGELPVEFQEAAEMYAGCVSGAVQKKEYIGLIEKEDFDNITIHKEKKIVLPDAILRKYLSVEQIGLYRESGFGIFSITVSATKRK